ncbi:12860_t:CDS:2 [Ambispora gerdemannii]|uniref:12860_t:CDS:1 n=1 Tax=Ambispora gerdemannii TaxID=144530 RepID=A0A9N8WK06_9GLOM|nr:12860_t:CDS:2 [Ambispora gerdemannii]
MSDVPLQPPTASTSKPTSTARIKPPTASTSKPTSTASNKPPNNMRWKSTKQVFVVEEEEFDVEKILDHKFENGNTKYNIKWKHYPDTDNSWVDEKDINGIDLILGYWKTSCVNAQNELQNAQKCINDKNNEIKLIQNEVQNFKDRIQNMERLKNSETVDMDIDIDQTMNTSENSSEYRQQNRKKIIQTPTSIRQKKLSDSSSDDDTNNKNQPTKQVIKQGIKEEIIYILDKEMKKMNANSTPLNLDKINNQISNKTVCNWIRVNSKVTWHISRALAKSKDKDGLLRRLITFSTRLVALANYVPISNLSNCIHFGRSGVNAYNKESEKAMFSHSSLARLSKNKWVEVLNHLRQKREDRID